MSEGGNENNLVQKVLLDERCSSRESDAVRSGGQ